MVIISMPLNCEYGTVGVARESGEQNVKDVQEVCPIIYDDAKYQRFFSDIEKI